MAFLTIQPIAAPPPELPVQTNTTTIVGVPFATPVLTRGAPPPPNKSRSDERNPSRRGRDGDTASANLEARNNEHSTGRGQIKDFFV